MAVFQLKCTFSIFILLLLNCCIVTLAQQSPSNLTEKSSQVNLNEKLAESNATLVAHPSNNSTSSQNTNNSSLTTSNITVAATVPSLSSSIENSTVASTVNATHTIAGNQSTPAINSTHSHLLNETIEVTHPTLHTENNVSTNESTTSAPTTTTTNIIIISPSQTILSNETSKLEHINCETCDLHQDHCLAACGPLFTCHNATHLNISQVLMQFYCDAICDCADCSDEDNCALDHCEPDETMCQDRSRCIKPSQVKSIVNHR